MLRAQQRAGEIAFALSLATGTGDGQTLEELEREYEGLL